ncbi:MAG: TetR/AcrR family transcriptional regulator [Planctomycetota bacterium]|jgi:AcrR family transcriptional regulator
MANADIDSKNRDSNKSVRGRLLDAAGQLFPEKGFDGTSVRDLAAAADCNIAAVNYHFGGKENLYVELWRRYLIHMREIRLAAIQRVMEKQPTDAALENLLRAFANAFLEPLIGQSRAQHFTKLMAREMLDRRLPADMFVEEVIVPTLTAMRQAFARICPDLDPSRVRLVVYSIVAQLLHAVHMKGAFEHTNNPEFPSFDLAETIEHVVRFSAAGIRDYAKGDNE